MAEMGSELLARIEDEFQVTILHAQATAAMHSLGRLQEAVCDHLKGPAAAMASRASYRTRRVIARAAKVPARTIMPESELESLLPLPGRVGAWKVMAQESGLEFPDLVHTRRCRDRFLVLSGVLSIIPVVALWWSLYTMGWLPGAFRWLFAGPAFVAWVVLISRINRRLLIATPQLAVDLPFATAGELATAVLALNMDVLEAEVVRESLTGDAVYQRVAKIVAERLGVPVETVDANTPIAEPLRT